MANIYNFLKNVWKEILTENKQNKTFIPFLLLLITLPISLAINNVLLGIFIVTSLFYVKKKKFKPILSLFFPIALFLWMALSYFWSINSDSTLKEIPKEIALLLVPLAFFYIPKYSKDQRNKIISFYSYAMVAYVVFFLIRAFIRFILTSDTSYFFYHGPDNQTDIGLVPRLLNAIHFSVYVAVAFFGFFTKEHKTKADQIIVALLFIFIILLSSKNIIIIFLLLILIQIFFYSKAANRLRLRNITILLILLGIFISFNKIKERFLIEFTSNTKKSISHNVGVNNPNGQNNISIYQAWNQDKFTHNDFFPGTSFRVYQIRMFFELVNEDPIFWKGYGLSASQQKLVEKERLYNLYPGYGSFNFHNQYIQNFAELGVIGLLLLLIILFINIKKAIKDKDFTHIAFAILMISLFLTESFLWRQRGVLFFILFYALFNHETSVKLEKK